MRLEVLQAKKGDCLLVHCGTAAAPALILVDGGPAGVWREALQPRLEEVRRERGLVDQPLRIDLVVVSHVDDDHINGVLSLFEHLRDKRERGEPPPFVVERLWHNAFDEIVGNDELGGSRASQFGVASLDLGAAFENYGAAGPAGDVVKLLASVEQGDRLRELASYLGAEVNVDFDRKLIQTGTPAISDNELGLEITVAGPRRTDLAALQAETDKWLRRRRKDGPKVAGPLLAALDDTSVANLSSIVLLLRDASGSILLTGDARSDKIIAGLADAGVIAGNGGLHVDTLKVQHHGSVRNIDEDFARRVTAKTYVFSGNGMHGNPDRGTLEILIEAGGGAPIAFMTTYPLDVIDRQRKAEHGKEQRMREAKGKPRGRDWDDATDALGTLLRPPPRGITVVGPDGTPRD